MADVNVFNDHYNVDPTTSRSVEEASLPTVVGTTVLGQGTQVATINRTTRRKVSMDQRHIEGSRKSVDGDAFVLRKV